MAMQESIFSKIIKGEIPCHKVFEDDLVIAFLDIAPFTEGHTLVVPKQQIDHLWDLPESTYQHVMDIVRKVANRQREVLEPNRVGIALEGFAVAHAHVHVFPLQKGLEYTLANKVTPPSGDMLAKMAERLAF